MKKEITIDEIKHGYPRYALDNISRVTNEALVQAYHNAYYTKCMALGHGKTQANHNLMTAWLDEGKRRGLSMEEFPTKGGFNGPGTT